MHNVMLHIFIIHQTVFCTSLALYDDSRLMQKDDRIVSKHNFSCGEMFGEWVFCLISELSQHLLTAAYM
jgi:hypothetical protein